MRLDPVGVILVAKLRTTGFRGVSRFVVVVTELSGIIFAPLVVVRVVARIVARIVGV